MAKSNKSDKNITLIFFRKRSASMEITIIDIIIFTCCAISLVLYTVSGFRKKMNFKEMYKERLEKILITIIILTVSSTAIYILLSSVQRVTK